MTSVPGPSAASSAIETLSITSWGIFYNGYEAQTGKPVLTGPPTVGFQEMFDVALEGYKRIATTLWPGKTSADSLAAGKFIHDTGYDVYGGYLQGMLGANPRHEPQIGPDLKAPRTGISTTNRAGWYTKPE